jgi:hypothetical protein
MRSNRFIYDDLRDIYTQIAEQDYRKKPPAAPIKKKKPTFEKLPSTWKYGSGYADKGEGGTKIRTTYKDWDEAKEHPKRKTLKEFIADAQITTKRTKPILSNKNEYEFVKQMFLAAKHIDDLDDYIGYLQYLSK